METVALAAFCVCAALIVWVYFGYPLALRCGFLGRTKQRRFAEPVDSDAAGHEPPLPEISVIIPAHNEEAAIEAKLRNLLDSDYPLDRIEILVGSDGSSDRTQEVVESFRGAAIGLISFPQHRGKSAIQNALVAISTGSVLVFTDADCLLPRDALRRLIQRFRDPHVGLVTGAPTYRNPQDTPTAANEGLYLRYETWLRKTESERGLLAMASGSLFAMRRSAWTPLAANHGDDFVLPLSVLRSRMRNVLESRACPLTDLSQTTPGSILRLKIRIVSEDSRALLENLDLLNPLRFGPIAIALWSHKLLRWLVPYFLLAVFLANVALLTHTAFRITLGFQAAFYTAAVFGFAGNGSARWRVLSIPASFCLVNLAGALGTLKAITGRVSGVWQPERVRREAAPRIAAVGRNEP